MDTGTKGPPLRLENLATYLDDKLEHEAQVLDLLIVAQARGQSQPELWDKLHSAALRDDRLTELAFAYEKLGQDRRVRIMPPPYQALIFMNAARFFVRALGDLDGAQAALERVLALVPGHPEAFEQLKRILEDKGDAEKLIGLYLSAVGPKTEKEAAVGHLRAALELATQADPDRASKIGQQLLKLDPASQEALSAICTSLEAAGKFPDLARALEQAVATDPPPDEARRLELRQKLLELYDDKVPEVERAAPHLEEILAREPGNAIARRVAARLLSNKAVGARVAATMEKVYEAEGDRSGVSQMLAMQIEQLRGPKKAEAQRRLGVLLHDDGDEANAYAAFESVLAIDPSDEEVRVRYVDLARKLGKQADAAKILTRAAAAVKSAPARAKINLDAARFLAELGDPKRARVILQGVLEQADDDVALEAARALRGLGPEPKALAPILESIARSTPDVDEKLAVLRELASLYETSLDDLGLAIQARKRVLQIDPTAEPEELERLLEARKDWGTLAEVLEIRAGSLEPGVEERRALLLRAASLRAHEIGDAEGARSALLAMRAEFGPARDLHDILLPLLEAAGDHAALVDVLTTEIDLADEIERSALITRLAESLLAIGKVEDALDAFAEVIAVRPDQPRARERLSELMRVTGSAGDEVSEAQARLRAAQILAPVYRNEDDAALVSVLEVIADLDQDPQARLSALAEAHGRVEAIGKDRVRALFLAGRGLREAVAHDLDQVPAWLDRIGPSEGGPSKAAIAETLASALRERTVDHPSLARLAQRSGEAYAASGDLARAIEAYRRVLEHEPDNEEMVERIDHLLAERGSPEERVTLYRTALERPGTDDRKRGLFLAIGGVQIDDLHRVDDAISTYREGLAQLPKDRALRDALLDALSQAKRYGELYDELSVERDPGAGDLASAELDMRLADVAVAQGEPAVAVRHLRDALAVAALGVDAASLDRIEELARAQVDVPLLVAVGERRVQGAQSPSARVEQLEKLGALFGDRSGDPARAAQCFLEAGEGALELGELSRAAAAFERVLAYQPSTREALERLLGIFLDQGKRAEALEIAGRLLRIVEDGPEALDLVQQLTDSAEHVEASDAKTLGDLVSIVESRFEKSIESASARARILLRAGMMVEAAETFAALLDADGAEGKAARALDRLLSDAGDDERLFETRRRLLHHLVETAPEEERRARRLELLGFERDVAKDTARAAAVLDELLEMDPRDEDALVARQLLATSTGDFATAAKCVERMLEIAPDEDERAARAIELARLRLEKLSDVEGALDPIEPFAESRASDPALTEVALAALASEAGAARAASVILRIARATEDAASRAPLYAALFERAQGASDPASLLPEGANELYREYLESLASDPAAALVVAARAAASAPEEEDFWDKAESLARTVKEPGPTAKAYREVLASAKGLDPEVVLRVGERGVAFHEEWFDDDELVTQLLRQVVEAAPDAAWAFERLKLVYNAAERWTELFDLYDRVIAAQADDEGRALMLEDAVEVARDLAGDQERAIVYLEQLRAIRPRDGRVESQLERLYERLGKAEALVALLKARLDRLEPDEARATRFRIAGLFESSGLGVEGALEVVRPLVDEDDEEAIALVERWLVETQPALSGPRGSFRVLARPVAGVSPVRAPAARLLEPRYGSVGEDEKAASMIEVLLEAEPDDRERLRWIRVLSERRSQLGDAAGALEAALAEVLLSPDPTEEAAAIDATIVAAAGNRELLGRTVDALREIGEEEQDRARSLRILRKASSVARDELADEARSITIDLAILSRSDEDPSAARAAARKLDRDLKAAGREVDRVAVLERLAALEDKPEARREALLEAARIAQEVASDRNRALKNLRKWLEEVPGDVPVLTKLIENLRALSDAKSLVRALDARAQSTRDEEEARRDRLELARLFARELDDRGSAIDAYRMVIERHGATDEIVDELADALDAEGRDVELGELLKAEAVATKDRERRAALYARLGDVERRRGQIALSLDAFTAALRLSPSSAKGQAGLETLLGAMSPDDPATQPIFALGIAALATSFEQAGQMDRWLALVPARLRAMKNDLEKCDLLLKAARLEEELAQNEGRALERTLQAFTLRPEFPGVAEALLARARKTGRWDLVAPSLLPGLAARQDIPMSIARDLLVEGAEHASTTSSPTRGDNAGLVEALLSTAHAITPQDTDVLERLVAHRRQAPSSALVDALLALSELRGEELDLLREALTVMLRDVRDAERTVAIARKIVDVASARLGAAAAPEGDAAEDALAWAIEILEPIWSEAGESELLRQTYLAAAPLAIAPPRARAYWTAAALLSPPEEAVGIYERLYASDSGDLDLAEKLAELYRTLERKADLARLYGRMAESAASAEERARLRLLQAEILVDLDSADQAIGVLRVSIGELATHVPTFQLLASLLEQRKAYADLTALCESQGDLARKADPARALGLYLKASALADQQLKDVQRAARSFRRAVDLDPSRENLERFATLLGRAKQYDDEAQVLERLIEAFGRDDETSLRLAGAYGHAGKVERAREELERAIAGGHASPKVREVLASIYRAAQAWESLAELFESEAEEAEDEAVKVARLRDAAQVYIVELGKAEQAVGLLERAAALRPDDLDGTLTLAGALRVAGRLDEARARLAKLIEDFGTRKPKERAFVHFELARVAIAEKNRAQALTELDNAAKIDPAHAGVQKLLGEIALEEGQFLRAQRTYRALLLVLRSQREGRAPHAQDSLFAPPSVFKSQVFVELAFIAEKQKDADRKAEFIESAFEASRESPAEAAALVSALERRGYFDLVARALSARLESAELEAEARTETELALADLYAKKLGKQAEAADLVLTTFKRALASDAAASTALEATVLAVLSELGQTARLHDAIVEQAGESLGSERANLLLRAATVAEKHLGDDERAATALEQVLEVWQDMGTVSGEERIRVLSRLEPIAGRLAASSGSSERHARALEQIVELIMLEGGTFGDAVDPFYRLLEIHLAAGSADAAYTALERAVREDADGERVEAKLREAVARLPSDGRFVRLLEDFGRDRGRKRVVVDALELMADRAADPLPHLTEAFETSQDLEDPALTERILRRIVPKEAAEDTADRAFALTELADRRFAASDAREAADLWERAARLVDPDEERALLLRVADLANRVLGDPARAIRIYERLREREPADRDIWAPLADIYERAGDTEALAQLMDQTIPLVDDLKERAKLRLSLARLLEVTDPDRAAEVLSEALDEDPSSPETSALLERLYAATGRDDKLALLLDRELDSAKDAGDKDRVVALSLRIGGLRERLDQGDAALDAYHGALDWDPNNLPALRAAVRLHTDREDSLVMSDLLDRLLELEEGDEATSISLKIADLKLSTGDPAGAERALALGFKANPRSAELKQRLLALYTERNDTVGLAKIRAAEARLLSDPASRRAAILEAAEVLRTDGDPRDAADLYEDALQVDANDRDTLFYFMETCANSAQHVRAIAAVDRALALDPADPWLLFSRAVLREAIGESDAALDDLEAAFDKSGGQYANELRAHLEAALVRIGKDPSSSRRSEAAIRLRLAEVAAYGGDVDSARIVVEELLHHEPDNPSALAALGKIEELAGDHQHAVLTYDRAAGLAHGQELVTIALRLYEASRALGKLGMARSGLEHALHESPTHAGVREALRIVYEDTGALLELAELIVEESRLASSSEAQFEKLIEAARLLLYGGGESSVGPAMAERALAVLEDARNIRATDQDMLQLTSEALAALGRGEEARGVLAQLIGAHRGKRSRELGQVYYSLYRVESKGGNLSEALEALSKAHDNQPQNGAIALELGQLASDLDEVDIAQRAFRSVTLLKTDGASGITPQDRAIAYFHLGSIAFKQSDIRRAKLMLEKAIAEDPSIPGAREMLAQLPI